MKKMIRDEVGRTLGYTVEDHQTIKLFNEIGRELGYYDKSTKMSWQTAPKKIISREGDITAMLFIKKF